MFCGNHRLLCYIIYIVRCTVEHTYLDFLPTIPKSARIGSRTPSRHRDKEFFIQDSSSSVRFPGISGVRSVPFIFLLFPEHGVIIIQG